MDIAEQLECLNIMAQTTSDDIFKDMWLKICLPVASTVDDPIAMRLRLTSTYDRDLQASANGIKRLFNTRILELFAPRQRRLLSEEIEAYKPIASSIRVYQKFCNHDPVILGQLLPILIGIANLEATISAIPGAPTMVVFEGIREIYIEDYAFYLTLRHMSSVARENTYPSWAQRTQIATTMLTALADSAVLTKEDPTTPIPESMRKAYRGLFQKALEAYAIVHSLRVTAAFSY